MSNHNVTPTNENHEIMVGWDPPMNTYFAHIIDTTKNEDEAGRDILWIGCTPNEIHIIGTIRRALTPYAHISETILSRLYADANQ